MKRSRAYVKLEFLELREKDVHVQLIMKNTDM